MTDQTNKDLPELSMARHDLFDLSTELLGVIEDVKNGMPFDDVCMETIISVRERLACRAALSASAPATETDWQDTCMEVLDAIGYTTEAAEIAARDFPKEKISQAVTRFLESKAASAPAAGSVPSDEEIMNLWRASPWPGNIGVLVVGFARALLAQYGSPAWQPIETAPHETLVLLSWAEWDGEWKFEVGPASWGWTTPTVSNMSRHGRATHWMPLPPAPQEGK